MGNFILSYSFIKLSAIAKIKITLWISFNIYVDVNQSNVVLNGKIKSQLSNSSCFINDKTFIICQSNNNGYSSRLTSIIFRCANVSNNGTMG